MDIKPTRKGRSLSYADLVREIWSYGRSETAAICAHALWTLWLDRSDRRGREDDYHVSRANLPRLFSIAAASVGVTKQRAREKELLQWCHDLVTAGMDQVDQEHLLSEAVPRWRAAMAASASLAGLQITDAMLVNVDMLFWVARVLRSQWEARAGINVLATVRTCHLFQTLDRKHAGNFFHDICRYLNSDPIDFARAGVALYSFSTEGRPPGTIQHPIQVTDELLTTWGTTSEALHHAAERLSATWSDFANWHGEVMKLPERDRIHAPLLLSTRPLLRPDAIEAAPVGQYRAPSPAHFLWAIPMCLREALQGVSTSDRNWEAALGTELEEYIFTMLCHVAGSANVLRIPRREGQRTADFAVAAGPKKAILIESKSSIGSVRAKSLSDPAGLVAVLDRLAGSYEQCAKTIEAADELFREHPIFRSVRRFVCVVTYDEVLCLEGGILNALVRHAGALSHLNVDKFEAMSVQDLEAFMVARGPCRLFREIERKWKSGHAQKIWFDYVGPIDETRKDAFSDRGYLDGIRQSVFPNLDLHGRT